MSKMRLTVIAALLLGMAAPGVGNAADTGIVLHPRGALSTLKGNINDFQNFYVSAPLDESVPWRKGVPQAFEYGVSWYSTMYPVTTTPTQGNEIGLNSTWISADNRDQPDSLGMEMCKAGANENFRRMTTGPDSGNAGLVLFQTIEGSMGWWKPDRFPSVFPKYRLNVTQNCYQTLQATPGWGFYGDPTPEDRTGVLQISNRILMPPDGITFEPDFSGKSLGTNWQALRLPNFDHAYNNMAGENNWTLFLNGANFSGPVAFIAPQYWSDGALLNPAQANLGLDRKGGVADLMSSEWEVMPYLSFTDASGTIFSKIPDVSLPVDGSGRFVLGGDFTGYAKRADLFSNADTYSAKLTTRPTPLYQGGLPIPSLVDALNGKVFGEGRMYGFQLPSASSSFQIGPYFKQVNGEVVPVPESAVPSELVNATLPKAHANVQAVFATPGWWDMSKAASKEFSANLSDGSIAVYRWFKFVDQPAFSRFRLTAEEKTALQAAAVEMQSKWTNNPLMAPPSIGALVKFDPGVTVTPPTGMETGYVPIVVKQYATTQSVYSAERAIYESCVKSSNGRMACAQPIAPVPSPTPTATPTPTPTPSATPTATPTVTPTPVVKKTIACVKGTRIRKVTAVSPKCPTGFRRKR